VCRTPSVHLCTWVSGSLVSVKRGPLLALLLVACLVLSALAACRDDKPPPEVPVRPVRAIMIEKRATSEKVSLPGHIEAQEVINLAFRGNGRMIERNFNVGDRVEAGQIVARIESGTARNAVQAASADVTAAAALLMQTQNQFERQEALLRSGHTTRVNYDQALQAQQAAQAQLDAANARLSTARTQLSHADLVADDSGWVTHRGAEPGEVVSAGRMILTLAREGGRDAVFEVPAQVKGSAPVDPAVKVALAADPNVSTVGRVREVAPQADPVTRTFLVRVALADPPAAMRLGSAVTGTIEIEARLGIEIPASALFAIDHRPAVWIVDPTESTVSLRPVDVARFDLASVTIANGLQPGNIVVTAGVQALRPGQKVRLLKAP
jgi:RND family efflux transporter MFP subunit